MLIVVYIDVSKKYSNMMTTKKKKNPQKKKV